MWQVEDILGTSGAAKDLTSAPGGGSGSVRCAFCQKAGAVPTLFRLMPGETLLCVATSCAEIDKLCCDYVLEMSLHLRKRARAIEAHVVSQHVRSLGYFAVVTWLGGGVLYC